MSSVRRRLDQAGIILPQPPKPVAAYAPFVATGDLVFISGQISSGADGLVAGRLGADVDLEQGRAAARLCAINLIAQIESALDGDLDAARIVRLGGFVACAPGFYDIAKVIDGASELLLEIFAENGLHSRAAVGCPQLPLNAAVETDALIARV